MNLSLNFIKYCVIIAFAIILFSCNGKIADNNNDIVIENRDMRLVLTNKGQPKSLIHKGTGQECLQQDAGITAFSITQDMPYDNEIKLTYPAKKITFDADTLYREGNKLIVGFNLTDYEAVIDINITDNYIGFKLNKMRYKLAAIGDKRKTRIDEFIFLQLPVKNRTHFGEWLNVMWDNDVAVNLLATDRFCRIDALKRKGYKIFQAGGERNVKMENVGAALITTGKNNLLKKIDIVEHDFNLPLGVESRKNEAYKYSYYTARGLLTPDNIDEHIAFAKKAGFRQFVIYYMNFAKTMGHFLWRDEYPNGMEDLKEMTRKIRDAGMIPGFHIHYNKAMTNDPYVTPVPDGRLNLRRIFTLREDLDKNATTITVEENPEGCTLEDGRRMLKIGTEIISYENYTTSPPYRFINCKRGIFKTTPATQKKCAMIGLLDVDYWPVFVRFNQNTDIQNEVAARLSKIIEECGFRFLYYDGAEDVNPPYWYNVTKAQMVVYDSLKTKSLFAEGAQKTHFGWHLLTRGNAFDTFLPEVIKKATRRYPLEAIKMISNDFSSIDFGWIKYEPPGDNTIGIQPDMLEYVTSRAFAWNSIISLAGNLEALKKHPRTADNLEVIRRWEEVRARNILTDKEKESLKNETQEHILLIDEKGKFELQPYRQIINVAGGNKKIRAFIFDRNNKTWVVYWHTSGDGKLEINIGPKQIKLYKAPGKEETLTAKNNKTILPVNHRRYIVFNLPQKEVIKLLEKAKLY